MNGKGFIPPDLWAHPDLQPIDLAVYAALESFTGTTKRHVTPGQELLQRMVGAKRRAIRYSLQRLESAGFIRIERKTFGGLKRGNIYHLRCAANGPSETVQQDAHTDQFGTNDVQQTAHHSGKKGTLYSGTKRPINARSTNARSENARSDPSDLHRAAWAAWQAHLGSDSRTRQHRTRDGLPQSKELRAVLSSFVNSDRGRDFDFYFRYLASVNPWGWFDGTFAVNIEWATRPATRKKVAAEAYQQAKAASAEDSKQAKLAKFDGWLNDKGMYG